MIILLFQDELDEGAKIIQAGRAAYKKKVETVNVSSLTIYALYEWVTGLCAEILQRGGQTWGFKMRGRSCKQRH